MRSLIMQNNGSMSLPTATSSNSTIRPRNRRLISFPGDDENTDPDSNALTFKPSSNAPSPFASRGVSPIPQTHPSRSRNASPVLTSHTRSNGASTTSNSRFESGNISSKAASSIWGSSWSSLQGLASSVLGNEPMQDPQRKQKRDLKTPTWKRNSQIFSGGVAPKAEWGPATTSPPQLASGTIEERQALVQARKREALLSANTYENTDASGRYKRRNSNSRGTAGQPTKESQENAYVYVHHVTASDTIAGVTIKYGCHPETFRKVNRFWPNDSIQTRQTVLLPVDACTVRGRRVHEEFLSDSLEGRSNQSLLQYPEHSRPKLISHDRSDSTSSGPSVTPDQEEPWSHSHWVQVDGFPANISVARISRRALGFFPPTRRKSISFSDSASYSPSTSLDLGSRLNAHAQPPPPSSLTSSPRGSSSRYPRGSTTRNRSSSGSYFASRLHGPGGVGTLRGSSAVSPGPAQDSLNRVLGPHLPKLAPRSSFESIHSETSRVSSSTGLENVGGAIEGWVRKMAGKAAGWAEGGPLGAGDAAGKLTGAGSNWVGSTGWGGDLIELETPFEIGEDEDDGPGGSGNEETPRAGRFEEHRRTTSTARGSLSTEQHDDVLLRERFQSRARSRNASLGKSKDE